MTDKERIEELENLLYDMQDVSHDLLPNPHPFIVYINRARSMLGVRQYEIQAERKLQNEETDANQETT